MTIPDEAVQAAQNEFNKFGYTAANDKALIAAITAAQPFLQGVTRIGYVSAVELVTLQQIETCVDLFTVAQSGPMKFIPVYVASDQLFGNSEQLNDVHTTHTLSEQTSDMGNPITDKTFKRRIADALESVWSALDCSVEEIENVIVQLKSEGLDIIETVIPVSTPSPRAQALEEAAKVADGWADNCKSASENEKTPIRDRIAHSVAGDAVRDVAKSIRALSSQPVADGWLPIETAPKDGTTFIVVNTGEIQRWHTIEEGVVITVPANDRPTTCAFYAEDLTFIDEFGEVYRADGLVIDAEDLTAADNVLRLTHWRPLPSLPEASE